MINGIPHVDIDNIISNPDNKKDMKKYFLLICIIVPAILSGQPRPYFENVEFTINPAEQINTVGSDMSPFFVDGNLFYSSIREEYFEKENLQNKNKAFYDMYSAKLDVDGNIASARELVPGFGEDYHEGPASYCKATGELFVTLSNVEEPVLKKRVIPIKKIKLRLVIMKQEDGIWKIKEELPFNNKHFSFAHPAINSSGDILVFSSDIDSVVVGQKDLYMSVRKNGEWSKPKNLGGKINTEGNEEFPVFLTDEILAFASDGRDDCIGGLDVYYAKFPEMEAVTNIGEPINSENDDFGLVINNNEKVGYFSSDRQGSDDIFKFDISKKECPLNGSVINEKTGMPVPNAKVDIKTCDGQSLFSVKTDNAGKFSENIPCGYCISLESTSNGYKTGKMEVKPDNNNVIVSLAPVNTGSLSIYDADTKLPLVGVAVACEDKIVGTSDNKGIVSLSPGIPKDSNIMAKKDGYLVASLNTGKANNILTHNDTIWMYKKELNRTFVMDNIYYDVNKWDLLPKAKIELDKLIKIMNDNPKIKVELASHTDSRGSSTFNMTLSQKRSESAVKYMIDGGIDKNRIIAKGYGEERLVNNCKNGVDCTEAEHGKNRRTEFSIVGGINVQ